MFGDEGVPYYQFNPALYDPLQVYGGGAQPAARRPGHDALNRLRGLQYGNQIREAQVGLEPRVFESLTPKQKKILEAAMVTKLKEMGVNLKVKINNLPEEVEKNEKGLTGQTQLDEQDIKDRLKKIRSLPQKQVDLKLWFEGKSITGSEHDESCGKEMLSLGQVPSIEVTSLKNLGISWNDGKPIGVSALETTLDAEVRQKIVKDGYVLSTGFFGEPTKTPLSGIAENPHWVFLSSRVVLCAATGSVGVLHVADAGNYVQLVEGSPRSKNVQVIAVALHRDLMVCLVQQKHPKLDQQTSVSDNTEQKRICLIISKVSSGVPVKFQTYHLPQTTNNSDDLFIAGIAVSQNSCLSNHFRVGVLTNSFKSESPKASTSSPESTSELLLYQYVDGSLTYITSAPTHTLLADHPDAPAATHLHTANTSFVGYHTHADAEYCLLQPEHSADPTTTTATQQKEFLLSTVLQDDTPLLKINLYGCPKHT